MNDIFSELDWQLFQDMFMPLADLMDLKEFELLTLTSRTLISGFHQP